MKRIVLIYILGILAGTMQSQVTVYPDTLQATPEFVYYIQGDSIPRSSLDLDEVMMFSKLKFRDKLQRRKYLILRRKTRKVFPYARLASERLITLNERMENIKRKSQKRRYARRVNKFLEEEFSAELKKLTRTEGQILIKLIHRQTGMSTFELVKNLRSGWKAFWYNTTASAFKISLKEEYHPELVEEDYWIEEILQRDFDSGKIEKQESVLDFDYWKLENKWKTPPDIVD